METFLSFAIAVCVTFFFLRHYLQQLTPGRGTVKTATAEAQRPPVQCPRCTGTITADSTFCPQCGAALSLWTVHRADVRPAGQRAPEGRPRPVINASICIGCGSCVSACPENGALQVVAGKSKLVQPERCVGHAKCAEACPTQALSLAIGDALQTIRVPFVKENFETNVPGVYIIGELGGVGMIKTGINEGKMLADHLRQQLQTAAAPEDPDTWDVLIVGSGPAGLSAALTAHYHGLNYMTVEQGEIASTIRQYPRQKLVMAEPVEMPLYGSLYIADGSKDALLKVWESIISNTGVRIQTGTRAESVKRDGSCFQVETNRGGIRARFVVLAIGKRGTPRRLGVPGEDLAKVTYRLIEAETYSDVDVLVAGGGDSAVEAALGLAKDGRNRVTLAYRGEAFVRLKERNRQLLETAEKEGRLRVLCKSNVTEIRTDSVVLESRGTSLAIPNHYVFVMIGGDPPEAFLSKIGVHMVEKAIMR